jgi:hypothetical protein
MNATTISSQRYLDDETVNAKREAHDYTVAHINITVEGIDYRVIVDGHHSYAAAVADAAEIDWQHERMSQADADALGAIDWLEAHQHDSDWYDVVTGINIW